MSIRPSSLEVAQYCGLVGALERTDKGGMWQGERGTAVHLGNQAQHAKDPTAEEAYLTALRAMPKEDAAVTHRLVESLEQYNPPASAQWEVPWALDAAFQLTDYDDEGRISRGKIDTLGEDLIEGERIAVVDDIKTGANPAPAIETIQLLLYGAVGAKLLGVDRYICRIVKPDPDGGEPAIDATGILGQAETDDVLQRLRAAYSRPPTANTGPWCGSCFQRTRCPKRMLVALNPTERDEALAPLSSTDVVTAEQVARLALALDALNDVKERGKEFIHSWLKANGPLQSEGRELHLIQMPGRTTINKKRLEHAGLLGAAQLAGAVTEGAPFFTTRWKKA